MCITCGPFDSRISQCVFVRFCSLFTLLLILWSCIYWHVRALMWSSAWQFLSWEDVRWWLIDTIFLEKRIRRKKLLKLWSTWMLWLSVYRHRLMLAEQANWIENRCGKINHWTEKKSISMIEFHFAFYGFTAYREWNFKSPTTRKRRSKKEISANVNYWLIFFPAMIRLHKSEQQNIFICYLYWHRRK